MLLYPGCSLFFPRTWVKNRRRIPSIKNVVKPTKFLSSSIYRINFSWKRKKIPQHSLQLEKCLRYQKRLSKGLRVRSLSSCASSSEERVPLGPFASCAKYSRRMPGKARATSRRRKQLRRPRPRAARSTPSSPHPPGTIRISRFRSFVGMKKRTRRTYLHSPSTSETGPLLFLLFTSTPSKSSWIAAISLAPSALGLSICAFAAASSNQSA